MSFDVATRVTSTRNRLSEASSHYAALAGILALGTVLRGYDLDGDSLWIDEVFSIHMVSVYSLDQLLFQLPLEDPHPPLYFVILNGWADQFGATAAGARALSVLFGIGTIYVLYITGRRLFGSQTGLLAALFLAVSPMHIQYSRSARMYALLVFLTVLSMYFFVRLFEGNQSLPIKGGYVVASVLLLYTHVYAFFVVFAQVAFLSIWVVPSRWPSRLEVREWSRLVLITGVCSVPWVTVLALRVFGQSGTEQIDHIGQPTFGVFTDTLRNHAGALVNYPFAYDGSLSVTVSIIVILCAIALVWRSFVGYDTTNDGDIQEYLQKQYLLLTWLVVPLGLPFIVSYTVTPMFQPWYTIVAHGALWLLVAHGITRLNRDWTRVFVIALLLTSLVGVTAVYTTGDIQEDWRGVADSADERPEYPVFVTPEYTEPAFSFYSDRPAERIRAEPPDAVEVANDPMTSPDETVVETTTAIEEMPGEDNRFYVVALGFDRSENWIEDLESRFTVVDQQTHKNIELYLFDVDEDDLEATEDAESEGSE